MVWPFSRFSSKPVDEKSPKISPKLQQPEGCEIATVAAGCFWGVEHVFRHKYEGKGLYDCRVGYSGGAKESPSYLKVCTGLTGHAEALQISFDPKQISYPELIELFFKMHNPTTLNRQGSDKGTQYRSAIFTHNDTQQKEAEAVKNKMEETFYKNPIVTEIEPISSFFDATENHQKYLNKNVNGYTCPTHFIRTLPEKHGA
ncbi:peptide methionine sulfoxide reductase MsrA [Yarrowia lipolytica]|nr:peptide methionine sulfoxide reductase MsrA [Yarrowia lipolytica]